MSATDAILTGILILATSIWVGGLFAIAIVARVVTRMLDPAARVGFFRALGRTYGIFGTTSLGVAYAAGAALLWNTGWDPLKVTAVGVAAALAATLAAGMVQARRMTQLRRQTLPYAAHADDHAAPGSEAAANIGGAVLAGQVSRGAVVAQALRGLIGTFSLILLALGVLIAS